MCVNVCTLGYTNDFYFYCLKEKTQLSSQCPAAQTDMQVSKGLVTVCQQDKRTAQECVKTHLECVQL